MVHAQREMAPIVNLANRVLAGAERAVLSGLQPDSAKAAVLSECASVWQFSSTNLEILGREGAPLVKDGSLVATLSASSAVASVLEAAHASGVSFEALVSESRPALEGLSAAERLSAAGIGVTVVSDAALPGLVRECGLALVGADSISEASFVNKTGTYPLALAAREAGVELHVAAPEDRFIPAAARGGPGRPGPAEELLGTKKTGIEAGNRYFEEVPLTLVAGLVTERGAMAVAEVQERVRKNPISMALLQILFPKPLPGGAAFDL